ncbi:MAG: hypothetical protein IPP29_06930 [Bacteroidetes bacterium]|nr:hypothetical protein [Bacteroidota bacterium]
MCGNYRIDVANFTITPLNIICGIIKNGIKMYIVTTELNVAEILILIKFAKHDAENNTQ